MFEITNTSLNGLQVVCLKNNDAGLVLNILPEYGGNIAGLNLTAANQKINLISIAMIEPQEHL